MRLYKFENYKLSAEVIRSGPDIWLKGTFGPFGFEAITQECEECHNFITGNTSVWALKGRRGQRAHDNAIMAIEDRLAYARVPKLRQGESAQINL